MTSLRQLLKRPLGNIPLKVALFLLFVALCGFVDASYLTVEHYRGVIPPCTTGFDCTSVLTSDYSVVAGVPISLGGAIFYLILLVGIFAYIDSKKTIILKCVLPLTLVSFLFSLWLVYLQIFVIHSICLYCMVSAVVSTVLFVTSLWVFVSFTTNDDTPITLHE